MPTILKVACPLGGSMHRLSWVASKAAILIVVVVPLLATVFAIQQLWQRAIHLPDLLLLLVMYTVIAFGVTVGYHRMLTHRSFQPRPAVKLVLLILGSMGLEGPAVQWAATHTKHHGDSDRERGPQYPSQGIFNGNED